MIDVSWLRSLIVRPNDLTHAVRSELEQIFRELEEQYGSRDTSFTVADVNFFRMDSTVLCPDKAMSIYIDEKVIHQLPQWLAALAHESVHCLSFVRKSEVTYLEEGVAESFAANYFKRRFPCDSLLQSDPRYADAVELTQRIEAMCPGVIKAARKEQPSLSKITRQQLERLCPACAGDLACRLTALFYNSSECPRLPIEPSEIAD